MPVLGTQIVLSHEYIMCTVTGSWCPRRGGRCLITVHITLIVKGQKDLTTNYLYEQLDSFASVVDMVSSSPLTALMYISIPPMTRG